MWKYSLRTYRYKMSMWRIRLMAYLFDRSIRRREAAEEQLKDALEAAGDFLDSER